MRLYLSGWQATSTERELAVIKTGAMKYRCFSYAMVQEIPGLKGYAYVPHMMQAYDACRENNVGIMMDSGAVSYRSFRIAMAKRKKSIEKLVSEDKFIEMYVAWVKARNKEWDFYFTLDIAVNAKEIFDRHCILENLGLRPVPVVHGDGHVIEYLKRYADKGYKLIGIASPPWLRSNVTGKRRYLDAVFNEAEKKSFKIHGLAMTSTWQMLGYPYYSVDSSSWSRVASTGCIMEFIPEKSRMNIVHISDRECGKNADMKLNPKVISRVKEHVEAKGYDFDLLKVDFVERHKWNAVEMNKLAEASSSCQRGTWNLLF